MRYGLVKQLLAGAAAVLFTVAPAAATTFYFDQIGGFEFTTDTSQAGAQQAVRFFGPTTFVANGNATYSTIGWGGLAGASATTAVDPMGTATFSALQLVTQLGGSIDDDGVPVLISTLTHKNQPIIPPFLTGVTISAELSLFSDPGHTTNADGSVFPNPNSIPIIFTETTNMPVNNPGAGPETLCTQLAFGGAPRNPLKTICDDFLSFNPIGFAPLLFESGGVKYALSFDLVPQDIPNNLALCDLANGTCWTGEKSINKVDILMSLQRVPVPAPASLAFLGIGLLGLGLAGWRKRPTSNN